MFASLLNMHSPLKQATPEAGTSCGCGSDLHSYPSLPGRSASELPLVGPLLCTALSKSVGLLLGPDLATPKALLFWASPVQTFVQTFSHDPKKKFWCAWVIQAWSWCFPHHTQQLPLWGPAMDSLCVHCFTYSYLLLNTEVILFQWCHSWMFLFFFF